MLNVDKSHRGLVQVYTGPGKGKTTAALGLALRAAGHDFRVVMIRFFERDFSYGEHLFVSKYQPFEIVRLNQRKSATLSREERRSVAQQTLAFAEGVLLEGNHNLVILDDIFDAVEMEAISVEDIVRLITVRPQWVELVLTGRSAPREIMKRADLVTEMLMIKHPFYEGTGPRKGIDY